MAGEMVVQDKPKQVVLRDYLQKALPQISDVVRKHLDPTRLIKIALMAASTSPRLLECSPESILRSLLQSADCGLEPSGSIGGADLIPRKNGRTGKMEAQFQPNYRGLIRMAKRGGEIIAIEAAIRYERDTFKIARGLVPVLEHIPDDSGEPGAIKGAYAVAIFKNGHRQFEYMTVAEIEKVRKSSRAESGPWLDWYEEMCKKTVIKRLCKLLDLSPEINAVLAHDDAVESGNGSPLDIPVVPLETEEPERTKSETLKAAIAAKAGTVSVPEEKPESQQGHTDDMPGEPKPEPKRRGRPPKLDTNTGEIPMSGDGDVPAAPVDSVSDDETFTAAIEGFYNHPKLGKVSVNQKCKEMFGIDNPFELTRDQRNRFVVIMQARSNMVDGEMEAGRT